MPEGAETTNLLFEQDGAGGPGETVSYTASLIRQGRHRFYTLSMPSDVLSETCVVDTRRENPIDGFQRLLEKRRAKEIADYIDSGFGTIPTSIVLSAQPEAHLQYIGAKRTLRFRKIPRAFLILDGQHRVYGFRLASTSIRVPVVIYNGLNRTQECRLFMDINTKQRPVPTELLLDIKRLAETENNQEALARDVFDLFHRESNSPLFGLLSPSEKQTGKISRVTFNAALKPVWETFGDIEAAQIYAILSAYLNACLAGLRARDAEKSITNPTLFRALLLLFPNVAERVADRHGQEFTTEHFDEILAPFFTRVKKSELQRPPAKLRDLQENLRKAFRSGFSITAAAT